MRFSLEFVSKKVEDKSCLTPTQLKDRLLIPTKAAEEGTKENNSGHGNRTNNKKAEFTKSTNREGLRILIARNHVTSSPSFMEKEQVLSQIGDLGGSNKVKYISQTMNEFPKTKLLTVVPEFGELKKEEIYRLRNLINSLNQSSNTF